MGVSGDVAKGILIFAVAMWVYLILQFIVMNQISFALLLLVGLIIPLSIVAFEYRKNFREFQCNKCKHNFKVSYLRLLFTRKFNGTDPAPTGTAAYHLECPKCGDKSWLVHSG
jgi:hypothetical protein